MQQGRFKTFLWGQALLVGLLAASLALFVHYPFMRKPYSLPELKLVLSTIFMLAAALIAVLSATRFAVEGSRFDLFLSCGFFTASISLLAFTISPDVARASGSRAELWAAIAGSMFAWSLIAAAPFVVGNIEHRRAVLGNAMAFCVIALIGVWGVLKSVSSELPDLSAQRADTPFWLTAALAANALILVVAVAGFTNRYRVRGQELDSWLALGSTLMLFSLLHFIYTPLANAGSISMGDYLQLLTFGVLLIAAWRAIRDTEFGRAVAEERGRVAREIHDGLAQYLFAVSTHASMLEAGADPAVTLPRLKEAALAAQQEARFAFLALSSAAGRSPFDAALKRFVDFLTADGELVVEVEIDPRIVLGPDEQIELFRIVQEGLGNARQHAGARHAWVEIGTRAGERFVAVRDDGSGFEPADADTGEGLRNMRERAASIGGALVLRSSPGAGTALEVVLRT